MTDSEIAKRIIDGLSKIIPNDSIRCMRRDETIELVVEYVEKLHLYFEQNELVIIHKSAVTDMNRAERFRQHIKAFLADEGFEEERT